MAVNDLMDLDNLVYLLNYDTVYGVYKHRVTASGGKLVVNGKSIKFLSVKDPAQLALERAGGGDRPGVHRAVYPGGGAE